jgi:DNA polymerase I
MNKTLNPKLILIDGSSYLYRAFHALPPLTNSKGEPTGAIFGVVSMLRKLLNEYNPDYIAVIFDVKGKTFRHDAYTEYKAQRPPMPDDLQKQIEPLHAVITAMGLEIIGISGIEADDVIGTLTKQAEQDGLEVLIVSGDKDLAQLVNAQVTIIDTMNNSCLDIASVEKKFGVPPKLIADYLALVGDTSDNIPGIPKIGPKTAVKLLREFGSLDGIANNADKVTGTIGESLRSNLPRLPLIKLLTQLKLDVPLPLGYKDLTRKSQHIQKLIELYQHLEFKKWLTEISTNSLTTNKTNETENQEQKYNYQTVITEELFNLWINKLEQAPCFAFDTETNSLDTLSAEIIGISFAVSPDEAAYIPLGHNYPDAPVQLNRRLVLDKLKPILENPEKIKLGHNLKFDLEILANYGINVKGIGFDTMLESYVINSTNNRHNMDSLALQYLGLQTISFENLAGKGKDQLTFNNIKIEQATPYAAQDSDVVLKLHDKLWPQIKDQEKLKQLFNEIEMPLVSVLARLERKGVCIDAQLLQKQSEELAKRIAIIEEQSYQLAGTVFNLNSPKQLQEILFTKLKLPVLKKTPAGQPSTAEEVLQELALNYPLPQLLIEHRSLSKLKSTYTDSLPLQINPKTNRVHTSYNQAVTATGRLSSTNPNLQNIPIRTAEGRKVRQAFIAPINKKIVSADYSQIELRIMAHLSQDQNLLRAFATDADIHRATAAEIFSVTMESVSDDQRRKAKAINFGLIYGMSAFGLAQQLNISRDQAQQYMDIYFERYPCIKKYMQESRITAKQNGYVETMFGRRLYISDINSNNIHRRAAAERIAINAPMQGTAADIIKKAMIATDAWILTANLDMKMIMQVHDELVFEIAETDLVEATKAIQHFMSSAAKLDVPLIVNIGIGDNWDAAH